MNEDKCVHCGKEAKFLDSEYDPYCSEECFNMTYKVNSWKLDPFTVYKCKNCDTFVEICNECGKEVDGSEMLCDHEQGKHFCSMECFFKHWGWREIGDDN